MRKKRIILFSEGFGSGHTQAAEAIAAGIRQLTPTIQTRILELGTFHHPALVPWIYSAYRKAVTHQPKLYGRLYRNQRKKSLNRVLSLALHRLFYARTERIIRQLKPDLIICTHPFPNIAVSRLRQAGLDVPLCAVITDYDAHGTWVRPAVSQYYVSSEQVKNEYVLSGVPAERIEVTGIPVHPKFWVQHDHEVIRRRYKLKPIPTVLIMGGGWGMMDNEELLRYLCQWRDSVQLIFCLGSNDELRRRLSENPLLQHDNIRLLGYTNEIEQLMEISDLLITKPGGLTCTEGMIKGLPMLFHSPIPGQEEENCRYFTEHGFGELILEMNTVDRWMDRLVNQHSAMQEERKVKRQAIQSQWPRHCAEAIVERLYNTTTYHARES